MKKVVGVQFNLWDKVYYFDPADLDLELDDYVVVQTQFGLDMGKIISFENITGEQKEKYGDIKPELRKANKQDLDKLIENKRKQKDAEKACKQCIKKRDLPIKLVDVHINLDYGRITFAFIADGRVDFRDLLKDLNRMFKTNIRLQQLGIRDESKMAADLGCCGRPVCCNNFLEELGNVTSELADLQQVSHRGSERLSGLCGRLKCCLAYEKDLYEELASKFPALGSKIKTKQGKGDVVGWHILRGTVDVLLDGVEDKTTIELALDEVEAATLQKAKKLIGK